MNCILLWMQELAMLTDVVSFIPRPPRTIISSGFLSPLSNLTEIQGSAGGNRCESCFWWNVLLVTCRGKHDYEMMQWRKASTEDGNPLLLSTVLLCLRHAVVDPIMQFLLRGSCTTLPFTQVASDSALRAVCSIFSPGSHLHCTLLSVIPLSCYNLLE